MLEEKQKTDFVPILYYLVEKKNPPATQETRVQSLDWDDPLEKEMATSSSILAWRIPWMEGPGGLTVQRVGHDLATKAHTL